MPLKPDVQALLEAFEAQGAPPFDEMSVPQARDAIGAFRDLQGEPEPVGEVRDILVPGPAGDLPVRVYHPEPGTALPLLVYFHGGGWVVGNIEVVDKPCRALANASRCVVASAQYRLSPETKFPGPAEDCYAATSRLAELAGELGADPAKVGVGGDSAGGNLAAAVALMARDRGGPRLAYQLLIYPVTAPARGTTFASYRDNADGYMLTRGSMEWFWDHYLRSPEDEKNPYAAPLHAPDLSGLPPAMVVTAEFDPLRDEGRAYAERLQEAGVEVNARTYPGVIHGFFWMAGAIGDGRTLVAEMGAELRSHLG
ncbi:alpha/beta hydrolase [Pseudonocardia sp. DLS-67]